MHVQPKCLRSSNCFCNKTETSFCDVRATKICLSTLLSKHAAVMPYFASFIKLHCISVGLTYLFIQTNRIIQKKICLFIPNTDFVISFQF